MYILKSDNFFASILLYLVLCTFLCVVLILGVSHHLFYHVLRWSHYWSLNPRFQVHWSLLVHQPRSNDIEGINLIISNRTLISRTMQEPMDSTSHYESSLVQVKTLSLVNSARMVVIPPSMGQFRYTSEHLLTQCRHVKRDINPVVEPYRYTCAQNADSQLFLAFLKVALAAHRPVYQFSKVHEFVGGKPSLHRFWVEL